VTDKTPKPDTRRFDVTVHSTEGKHEYPNQTNDQARGFEDLPFTSSNVSVVEVRQK
jgi:hypothetical protein